MLPCSTFLLKSKRGSTQIFWSYSTRIYGIYTLPFIYAPCTSQYSHCQLMPRDCSYCSTGRTAVTDSLVSLVGKDVMYTALSSVISFSETTQNRKCQIRLLMMVKDHAHDFKCQELLHWQSAVRWRTVRLNQTVLVDLSFWKFSAVCFLWRSESCR